VSGGVLVPPAAGAAGSTPTAAELLPGAQAQPAAQSGAPGQSPAEDVEPSRAMRTSAGNPSAA